MTVSRRPPRPVPVPGTTDSPVAPADVVAYTSPRDGLPPVTDSPEALQDAARALASGKGPVSIDAERASGFRYGQSAYLIQLRRAGSGTILIDPLATGDLDPLARALDGPEWILHVADQMVIIDRNGRSEIDQGFIDGVRHWFSADLRRVDADQAQDALDAWVDRNTAGLIESSALKADRTQVALQNVVLFAAQWKKLFDEKNSDEADFTRADGGVTRVQMMTQTSAMACTEGRTDSVTWKVLRVPYSGSFILDLVLPQKGSLPEELPAGTWAAASALLDEAEAEGIFPQVNLSMPRIDLSTPADGVDILPVLDSLGPMGRVNPVFETIAYQQQVRLIVREDGTVAAAVSKHGDGVTAPNPGPTTDFRIDHPYVMRLRDLSTGVALFEAVINNPS